MSGDIRSDTENIGVEQEVATEEELPTNRCRKNTARIILALTVLGFIIYIIVDSQGDNNVKRLIEDFLQWVEDNPAAGVFALIGVYFIATVLFVPGSLLTLGAGFVFGNRLGLGLGVLLASVAVFFGAAFGAIGAFLLGRYLLRDSIHKLSQKYPVFQAIDSALGNHGFRIVTLLRLSPIVPFNATNYILGATAVPLREYILSCIGMLPGTVLYVFIGSSAGSIVESASNSSGNKILTIVVIVVGVIFGVGAVAVVTFYAKKELRKIIAENQAAENSDEENHELPGV